MSEFGKDSILTVVDGKRAPLAVPFGSNSLQHGTGVFDSVRLYEGSAGPVLLRVTDHVRRLLSSASRLGIGHDFGVDEIIEQVVQAASASGLSNAYIRPALVSTEPRLGVDLAQMRFVLAIEIWEAAEVQRMPLALSITVSSWRRPSPDVFPVGVKATGIYVMSALARTEAGKQGFDDALQLDAGSGRVAEASVSNVFLVKDGRIKTPWLQDSLLAGITRDCVLKLANRLGIPAEEGPVEVADILSADEVFLTGTASGLIPVRSVDRRVFDASRPVLETLHLAYQRAVTSDHDDFGWQQLVRPAT